MILIVAMNFIKQGKAEEFKKKAEKLIQESRKEKGCLSYNLYEDINNSNILTYIEEWENEEAINFHNNSSHFTTIVPQLAEFRERSEVTLYRKTPC